MSDVTEDSALDDDALDDDATDDDGTEDLKEAEDDADTSLTEEDAAENETSSGDETRSGSRDFADEVQSYVNATVERFTQQQEEPASQPDVTAAAKVTDTEDVAPKASTTQSNSTTTFTTMTVPEVAPVTVPAQPRPTLVSLVSETVASVLRPLMGLGTEVPLQMPGLWAMLAAARGEFEQALRQHTAPPAAQYTVTQISGPSAQANGTPYVLVIGVDGTNLGRILSDPENDHFFALMDEGTTAASSIVGHTTISNPSWTAILTGVWGETTGVVNNVFTPGPYNRYPTVFNMLETHDPNIETIAIANWNVIADIANAGSIPADQIHFVPRVPGDTNWLLTDDAVGAVTVEAIRDVQNGTPTFMFTYFVGVDENGHEYGGASPQYAEAIRNVDENIGAIMAEIAEREKCNPGLCESWTVIVVTDHGHQPQQGFGHGFQTPSETSTFVIARGSDFQEGFMNLQYEIVDTTPTVLDLFGAPPPAYSDGVSLTTLGDSDVDPVDLHQALFDAIAMNGYPDIATDVTLAIRTIFTSIPYFVYTFTYDTIDELRSIANQDIFLVSALAGLAIVPVQIVGNLLYVATNIPAQIVARLTGVKNNSIFPLIPAPPSTWPPSPLIPPNLALLTCGEGATAEVPCNTAIVA
ncbi:alkaline phosphatase family protein [Mycolicibacterium sp. XJ662]